jgi:hypothetical protein
MKQAKNVGCYAAVVCQCMNVHTVFARYAHCFLCNACIRHKYLLKRDYTTAVSKLKRNHGVESTAEKVSLPQQPLMVEL